MKRILPLVFLVLLVYGKSYAFDFSDLQPVTPNGVFSTFGTEGPQAGKAAIELQAERSKSPDFYRYILKAAFGISDTMECSMNVPYVTDAGGYMDGPEDSSFGFKHRFYDEGKYGPSIAYLLDISVGTGREEVSTRGRYGLGLIVSKRLGPFKGHLNFIYQHPVDKKLREELAFLGGIELSAAHNFKILAEFLAKRGYELHDYYEYEARFGYRIKTTDFIYTTLGVGTGIKDRRPEYRIILSVAFTSPSEKKEIKKIFEEE